MVDSVAVSVSIVEELAREEGSRQVVDEAVSNVTGDGSGFGSGPSFVVILLEDPATSLGSCCLFLDLNGDDRRSVFPLNALDFSCNRLAISSAFFCRSVLLRSTLTVRSSLATFELVLFPSSLTIAGLALL